MDAPSDEFVELRPSCYARVSADIFEMIVISCTEGKPVASIRKFGLPDWSNERARLTRVFSDKVDAMYSLPERRLINTVVQGSKLGLLG